MLVAKATGRKGDWWAGTHFPGQSTDMDGVRYFEDACESGISFQVSAGSPGVEVVQGNVLTMMRYAVLSPSTDSLTRV